MKRFQFQFLLVWFLIMALAACQGAAAEETANDVETPTTAVAEEDPPPAATDAADLVEVEEETAEDVEADDGPIKIGGLVPLSTPGFVGGGEAMQVAMTIAIEEINEAGGLLGRPVELLLVDTEGLPERGVVVMEALITVERVVAVGGGYHSSVGVAAKEVAHEHGIPTVFAETWNDVITGSMLPEVFRIAPLSSEVTANDVRFVTSLPDINKVVIVTENTDYGLPAAADTTQGLAEFDIEAITLGVDLGNQDFSTVVEQVKSENPDMIMVLATGDAAYRFQQQAADAGSGPQDIPMLCNQVSLESDTFWESVPDGNHCFVRRIGLPPQLYNEVTEQFVAKYTERTGKQDAESYAMEAYDSIKILAEAIEAAGSTEPEAIIAALESITYEGALGTITFPYGSSNPPAEEGLEDKWWHQFPDPAITIVQYQEVGQDSTEAAVVFPETFKTDDPILP